MTYNIFESEIERVLNERGIEYRRAEVKKLNGVTRVGVSLNSEVNVAPTIYLDQLYEYCTRNDYTLEESVDHLLFLSKENQIGVNFDVNNLLDFDRASKNLNLKLINKSENEEYLADKPFVSFGDLAIVFQIVLPQFEDGRASITLENRYIEGWGKTVSDLFEIALENIKDDFKVQNIAQMLCKMAPDLDMDLDIGIPMYVCTTESGVNGAIVMVLLNKLAEVGENFGENLYILPSSVHEILLIPEGATDASCFNSMINEVNSDVLAVEEKLSNHYYFFNYTDKKMYDHENHEMAFVM